MMCIITLFVCCMIRSGTNFLLVVFHPIQRILGVCFPEIFLFPLLSPAFYNNSIIQPNAYLTKNHNNN